MALKRRKFAVFLCVLSILCTALSLSSCAFDKNARSTVSAEPAPLATQQPARGGTIKAALAHTIPHLNPDTATSAGNLSANWHVVEGLYELDLHTFQPYRALAKEDTLKRVTDVEYEVSLRKDAKFSTGQPVTARDVVASFQRVVQPHNEYYSLLSFIDRVDIKDEESGTLTIHLRSPLTLLRQRLALVKITPEGLTEEERQTKPIGSGPWAYDTVTPTSVTFTPNKYYSGIYPATADRMEWELIPDTTARATAFEQGRVNVMESVPPALEDQLTTSGATLRAVAGYDSPFFMFNTRQAPLNDRRVRQAFFYAVDTQRLINTVLHGGATEATALLPDGHKNYHQASTVYSYNPDKARQLLSQAGFPQISVTLLASDNPWVSALVPQIVHDLQHVGINVSVQTLPSADIYANYTDVHNPTFDVVLAPGDPSVFGNSPDMLINWWFGDNVWTQQRTGWNTSPSYTQLHSLMDASHSLQNEELQEAWNKAGDIIATEVPLYPLLHRNMVTAYREKQITNYAPISTPGLNFINAGAGGK